MILLAILMRIISRNADYLDIRSFLAFWSAVNPLILQGQYLSACRINKKKVQESEDNEHSNVNINFEDVEKSPKTVITMMVIYLVNRF